MGQSRTSMKDVLNAIEALTTAITSKEVSGTAPAPLAVASEETPVSDIKIDKAYAEHMVQAKVAPFATKHQEDAVLYARKNGRGETKLAYCLASKFAGLKDRGLLGAIEVVSPTES